MKGLVDDILYLLATTTSSSYEKIAEEGRTEEGRKEGRTKEGRKE